MFGCVLLLSNDLLGFSGGIALEDIAVLGVAERTVKREWQKARAFLFHAMESGVSDGDA